MDGVLLGAAQEVFPEKEELVERFPQAALSKDVVASCKKALYAQVFEIPIAVRSNWSRYPKK